MAKGSHSKWLGSTGLPLKETRIVVHSEKCFFFFFKTDPAFGWRLIAIGHSFENDPFEQVQFGFVG